MRCRDVPGAAEVLRANRVRSRLNNRGEKVDANGDILGFSVLKVSAVKECSLDVTL